jgi:30S ribosomal protein S31
MCQGKRIPIGYKYFLFKIKSLMEVSAMGKGDIRSKRGKIWRGTFGNCRPKKKKTTVQNQPEPAKTE